MRVKLSYTVEEEDILSEAAKILNMAADDMQQALDLYKHIPLELKGDAPVTAPELPPEIASRLTSPDGGVPNTLKILNMIEEFRQCLLSLDTRFAEVAGIIEGYDNHVRSAAAAAAGMPAGNARSAPGDSIPEDSG